MRGPGRSGTLARRIALVGASAGLALIAAWHATAMAMHGPNPALVVAIDRTNPLALPMVVDQLSAVDKKPGMPRENLLGLVRTALKRQPLTPRALRQLAAWEESKGQLKEARALLDVGARVGRRDPLLNIMLAKDAAREGDGPLALRHLDAALSTFPEADREVFPLLTRSLADPSLRGELKRYMDRPWAEPFMLHAAQNGEPEAVLDLALSAPRVQTSTRYERFRSELVSHLVSGGAPGSAVAYVRKVAPRPGALEEASVTAATTDTRFAPVTWRLRNADGLYVTAEGGRFIVSLDPAARGRALERVFDLPAGRHVLSVASEVPEGTDPVMATWTASCLRGRESVPLSSHEGRIGSGTVALPFVVPAGCDATGLTLDLVSRSDQHPVEYGIVSIRLSGTGA
ncbi:tetratricopeptide repeat protein [Tsuneonella sp. SYSU-LHT278]|uniref:tetratricopeptide repeat protein n=1 Tax=Tsuneonella sediminis TaxID=3416089 RepID=UPI003F797881